MARYYRAVERDPRVPVAFEKAYPDCVRYAETDPPAIFIGWQSEAWADAFLLTGRKEYAEFALRLCDRVLAPGDFVQYRPASAPVPEYIGGFGERGRAPGGATLSFLEGIAAAFRMSKESGRTEEVRRLGLSLALGARYLLNLQFVPGGLFGAGSRPRTEGGIRQSLSDVSLRCENVCHAAMTLYTVYDRMTDETLEGFKREVRSA
jgi:hypothetical protein